MRGRTNLKAWVVISVIWPVLLGGTGVAAAGPVGTWEGSWRYASGFDQPFTWVLNKDWVPNKGLMTGTWLVDLLHWRLPGTATVTVSGTYVYDGLRGRLRITASGNTIVKEGYMMKIDLAADGALTGDSVSGTLDIESLLYQGKLFVAGGQDHVLWSAGRVISITVTAPNGGESWELGTDHDITWTTSGSAASDVRIDLYKGGSYDSLIVSSTANDRSYSWTVPLSQAEGSDYKVKIRSTANSSYDYSDSDFSIFAHHVNLREFAVFAGHWMESDCGYCGGADLTRDGKVRIDDLDEFVSHYSELPGPEDQPEAKHWDFEDGTLQGWVISGAGEAFKNQPTYGNNVSTWRAKQNDSTFGNLINDIGGDYWDGPCPIGIQGEYWIGTYENRPSQTVAWGSTLGVWFLGILLSPEFTLGKQYIHFLIGGGDATAGVVIELQVKGSSGLWVPVAGTRAAGKKDERLERVVVDLAGLGLAAPDLRPDLLGRLPKARLYIHDLSSGPWGHINIDDIWVTDTYPDDVGKKPPVWGFADTHAHLAARLAYEGRLIWGCTSDLLADGTFSSPTPGLETANSCPGDRYCPGTAHTNDGTSGFAASKFIYALEDQLTFGRIRRDWPSETPHTPGHPWQSKWYSLTHQQMYEKWVYRAYKGGLRLLVAEALNNRVVAWSIKKGYSIETDSKSYKEQIERIHEIVDRNHEWMEIALDPGHARRIINDSKLAVVIGIEVDSFGGCDLKSLPSRTGCCWHAGTTQCNIAGVLAELRELFEAPYDVRQLQPIHLTDNGFGGAAVYQDQFNIANHFLNADFFAVNDGSASGVDWEFKKQQEQITENMFGRQPGPWPVDVYKYEVENYSGHVNKKGLTADGRDLIREMMKLGMIIAVDHMSEKSLDEVLGLRNPATGGMLGTPLVADPACTDMSREQCQEKAYPVALTHSVAREVQFAKLETVIKGKLKSESGKRRDQIERINLIGGIAAPGIACSDVRPYSGPLDVSNDCAGSARSFAQLYNYFSARRASIHGLDFGMPIGTDFNGLNGGVPPRYGIWGCFKRNSHVGNNDLSVAISLADPFQSAGEGRTDYDQRNKQLPAYNKGVNYGFYNASPGTYVWHWTPLTVDWTQRTHEKMYVKADQPALKAAKKRDGDTSWGNYWDINFDGVAHYGMLPDFFQDLRALGASKEDMGPLFLGAEAYIRMWEKAWKLRASR